MKHVHGAGGRSGVCCVLRAVHAEKEAQQSCRHVSTTCPLSGPTPPNPTPPHRHSVGALLGDSSFLRCTRMPGMTYTGK